MEHEILDSLSRADIAFRVRGDTPEDLFSAGARALVAIMLEDTASVRSSVEVSFTCASEELDLLYFDFLSELVFYKDSEKLLLLPGQVVIISTSDGFVLSCRMCGEKIDRKRHGFSVDIKAVTMHNLLVEKVDDCWSATAVVDV